MFTQQQIRNSLFCLLSLLFLTNVVSAKLPKSFKMGQFNIEVTNYISSDSSQLSGIGKSSLGGYVFPVKFKGVKIVKQKGKFQPQKGEGWHAVSGEALGLSPKVLTYTVDEFRVAVPMKSILLTPYFATTSAEVDIPMEMVMTLDENTLKLAIKRAFVEPSGGICGYLGAGHIPFRVKDVGFGFEITSGTVKIGKWPDVNLKELPEELKIKKRPEKLGFAKKLLEGLRSAPKGISLSGKTVDGSSGYERASFNFKGIISAQQRRCEFTLSLDSTYEYTPCGSYTLTLKSGDIRIVLEETYSLKFPSKIFRRITPIDTVITDINLRTINEVVGGSTRFEIVKKIKVRYSGSFLVDLKLPENVPNLVDEAITLSDIYLELDIDGNLVGKVTVPKFKIGRAFMIECADSAGWVFFPLHDTLGLYEKIYCEELLKMTGVASLQRQGVSILNGNFSFYAPQAGTILHTPFWGTLTLTYRGIIGQLTSANFSLVPEGMESPDTLPTVQVYSLTQIIAKGDTLPDEPEPLFRLAGLQILTMTIDSIVFCDNEIQASNIKEVVHFPYPSYIDLEFCDTSLDSRGRFHEAIGPPRTGESILEQPHTIDKDEEFGYGARGKILWFWRLPVLFYANGTTIHYDNRAEVMINTADIRIAPLSSQDPLRTGGVPFAGSLAPDGQFDIVSFDSLNWFGEFHAKNFECKLDWVQLADYPDSMPAKRPWDLRWKGRLKFPFFGWDGAHFTVRDLVCSLEFPLSITASNQGPSGTLYVKINSLDYSAKDAAFLGPARYQTGTDSGPANASIKSFTWGILRRLKVESQTIEISRVQSTECGKPKTVIQQIADAIPKSAIIDLICYDNNAYEERFAQNPLLDCEDGNVWYGTYEVLSISQEEDTSVVLSIPDCAYIIDGVFGILDFESVTAEFSSEESGAEKKSFGVPGARIWMIKNKDGTFAVGGWFETSIDIGLPVEGSVELGFELNPECAYFCISGEAEFTYYLKFGGYLLISHAPVSMLTLKNSLNDIAEEVNVCRDSLDRCLGISSDNDILTGAFTRGSVAWSVNIIEARVGAGCWYFQTSSTSTLGALVYARGNADLFIIQVSISGLMSGTWQIDTDDITVYGKLEGCACLNGLVAYVKGTIGVEVWIRTLSGWELGPLDTDIDKGLGGCSCP